MLVQIFYGITIELLYGDLRFFEHQDVVWDLICFSKNRKVKRDTVKIGN